MLNLPIEGITYFGNSGMVIFSTQVFQGAGLFKGNAVYISEQHPGEMIGDSQLHKH